VNKTGTENDFVDTEYIEGDKFGKKTVKTKKEVNIRGGPGL